MAVLTRAAQLQDLIEGRPVVRSRVRDLAPTVTALGALSLAGRPDPDFVAALGRRLRAEAAEVASATTVVRAGTQVWPTRRATREPGPVIILVGRGLPRILAGVAASLVAVGSIVGVAARSALPGQALYPVKQVLDSAAVRFAGSDADKGATWLGQAQEHIVDASQLVATPNPASADVDLALEGAIDAVTRGQSLLRQSFAETHDPRALRVIQDFSDRAVPQVDALSDRVAAPSLSLVTTLRALLGPARSDPVRELASCQTCSAASEAAPDSFAPAAPEGTGPSALPDLPETAAGVAANASVTAAIAPGAAASAPGTAASTPGAASIAPGAVRSAAGGAVAPVAGTAAPSLPGTTATVAPPRTGATATVAPLLAATVVPLLGTTATVAPAPGVVAGVGLPSINAGTSEVSVGGAGVGIALPVGGASVGLPGSTVSTGGVTVGGGSIGATLPGVSITAPHPGVTLATTQVCALGICLP